MSENKEDKLIKEYYREISELYWGLIEKNKPVPEWLHKAYTDISFLIISSGSANLRYGV